MSRKKVTQVRLHLESLEDRMVLSSMGVLPVPTGTPPPALMSSSQLPGMTTTGANGEQQIMLNSRANGQLPGGQLPGGQLPGMTRTGASGQQFGLATGANGQQPGGQLPGLTTTGANGQQPGVTMIGANGQLPGGQLPYVTMIGANGQQPGVTTGAKGQEHIITMKSGTVGSNGQEKVVLRSGANGQQPGLIPTGSATQRDGSTHGASDLATGPKAS